MIEDLEEYRRLKGVVINIKSMSDGWDAEVWSREGPFSDKVEVFEAKTLRELVLQILAYTP